MVTVTSDKQPVCQNEKMINYSRQHLNQADLDSVLGVLASEFLTQGPAVPGFEVKLAERVGAAYAIAANSATSALHLACLALEVGPGDVVWTSPNSFAASANCARYCGADVDFVDINPRTLCMDPQKLEEKLVRCRLSGKKLPKVVIPVHFAGHTCDMPQIGKLASQYGFRVIEDGSHAIGSRILNREGDSQHVGSCKYSDICVFSFHPVKIITTGEGGAALTNNSELAQRLRALRTHGIHRPASEAVATSDQPWIYDMRELGFNYRMTDVQAALGMSQLNRLDEFVDKRQRLAALYRSALGDLVSEDRNQNGHPTPVQVCPEDCSSSFHLFVIHLPSSEMRLACFRALMRAGFGPGVHYIPIHTHSYYRALGFSHGDFPVSESHYASTLSLPLFPTLESNFVEEIASIVKPFMLN